jgi:hypothetical protein
MIFEFAGSPVPPLSWFLLHQPAANFDEDHATPRLDQSQPWSKPENDRRYLLARHSRPGTS